MKPFGKILILGLVVVFSMMSAAPVHAMKIVIDPGHGGHDPGAIGVNGLQEKFVNLDISLKLQQELQKMGYEVVMTRTTDKYLSLQERVEFKEQEKADLFVSIHANSHSSSQAHGSEVLYYDRDHPQPQYPPSPEMAALTPLNKRFAQIVAEELSRGTGSLNRGAKPSAVYVARMGTMPSILVETAFLSNPTEGGKLASEYFRLQVAQSIARGIYKFAPVGFEDTIGHWASESIARMREAGIVEGYNNRFAPQRAVTRAEFLAMADRLFRFSKEDEDALNEDTVEFGVEIQISAGTLESAEYNPDGSEGNGQTDEEEEAQEETDEENGWPEEDGEPGFPAFSDLTEDHWGYDVITAAVAKGIVQGYPDGTVRPNQPIKRSEMAQLFWRMWEYHEELGGEPPDFEDVPEDAWYYEAVRQMAAAGIIYGTGNGQFAPDRSTTRAEAATVFDRYYQKYVAAAPAVTDETAEDITEDTTEDTTDEYLEPDLLPESGEETDASDTVGEADETDILTKLNEADTLSGPGESDILEKSDASSERMEESAESSDADETNAAPATDNSDA